MLKILRTQLTTHAEKLLGLTNNINLADELLFPVHQNQKPEIDLKLQIQKPSFTNHRTMAFLCHPSRRKAWSTAESTCTCTKRSPWMGGSMCNESTGTLCKRALTAAVRQGHRCTYSDRASLLVVRTLPLCSGVAGLLVLSWRKCPRRFKSTLTACTTSVKTRDAPRVWWMTYQMLVQNFF